jgi:hypothetical protein
VRRQVHRLPYCRVVEVQVAADGPQHHLAGIAAHPALDIESWAPPQLLRPCFLPQACQQFQRGRPEEQRQIQRLVLFLSREGGFFRQLYYFICRLNGSLKILFPLATTQTFG